jgi:ATPase subunit of ABC transporter with duplicated ATPase domains
MKSITLKGIQKSFRGIKVLDGVNFTLSENKRFALVGDNGSGKSTLLKILTGRIEADDGKIVGLENCALIAQDFSGKKEETPHEFLTRRVPVASIGEAVKMLRQMGFEMGKNNQRLKNVKCGKLSGGEKKKLEIAAGLTSGLSFIAVDEPENFIDVTTVDWLIATLSKMHVGLIIVSHDSYFINQLSDTVLELKDGNITSYTMKYDAYLAEKENQIKGCGQKWEAEEKEIKRKRKSIEMQERRAARNSGTAGTYKQNKRRLEKMEKGHGRKPTSGMKKTKIRLSSVDQKKGKRIVAVNHVYLKYDDDLQIFSDANAVLNFGEKVVLCGDNGSGKTTLAKCIIGELSPDNGSVRMGPNINWRFMSQDHLEGLDPERSAFDIFRITFGWSEDKCRAPLANYAIDFARQNIPLKNLSGGEQARFKLALTFAQQSEFLILDEPTNHIDPNMWEVIVKAIKEYTGTVLIIAHEQEFIDEFAQKLWIIEDQKIHVVDGNMSDYLEQQNREEEVEE